MRRLTIDPKDFIAKMKKILVDNEHHSTNDSITKKYFISRFLTATNWKRDHLDKTMAKIYDVCRSRDATV